MPQCTAGSAYKRGRGFSSLKRDSRSEIADYLMEGKEPEPIPFRAELEPVVPPQIYLPVLDQEACAGSGFNWTEVESGVKEWMPWPTFETGGTNPKPLVYSVSSSISVSRFGFCLPTPEA